MALDVDPSTPTAAAATLDRSPRPGRFTGRAFAYWWTTYKRTWRGSAVSGFLAPLLYLGSLGYGLGTLVDKGGHAAIGGVPYAAFVAPGVLAATAMQAAVNDSTYPVMGAIKWQRQYHAMLAGPLGALDVLLGHVAFILLKLVIVCSAFVAVGAGLGALRSWWVLVALPVAVLCGLAHATPTMAYAARQDNDFGFAMVFRFVVMPMFLFSGTFFPVSQLPEWLQPFCWLSPLWHGVQLCRGATTGDIDGLEALANVAILVAVVLAGAAWGIRTFTRKLST